MRNRLFYSLILIIGLCFGIHFPLLAQFKDMEFDVLNVDKGLTQNWISCVFRDNKGYLWIGSELGLNKYDGNKILIYEETPLNPKSISSNFITCIFEDSNQDLWIGTKNGLNKYDRKTDSFIRFYSDKNNNNKISSNNIRKIVEDKLGNLWIATANGLNSFSKQNKMFNSYIPSSESKDIITNSISSLEIDSYDNIWMVTYGNKLWKFDPTTFKFTSFSDKQFDKTSLLTKRLVIDSSGIIWISTYGKGLFSFNTKSKTFSNFPLNNIGTGTNSHYTRQLFIDNNRYLLIATDHGGLNRLDLKTKTFEYCVHDIKNTRGLNNDNVCEVYIDKEGILYAGTSASGLNIYNPKTGRFKIYSNKIYDENSLSHNAVRIFYEDSQGLIWIGTYSGGLSVFDPKNKEFTNYQHNPSDPYSISGNNVTSIVEDKNNNVWISIWDEGLCRFDRKSQKFTRIVANKNDPNALYSNDVYCMAIDKEGLLWISCLDYGIQIFNVNTGLVKRFKLNSGFLTNEKIRLLKLNNSKSMGIVTTKGYVEYDFQKEGFYRNKLLYNIELQDVLIDKNNNYWVSTKEKGLWIIWADGTLEKHDKTNGFPTNTICGLLEDEKGDIWISSYYGISRYISQSKQYRHYSKSDGLQGKQFSHYAKLKASDGTLYFGGSNGFNAFKPIDLKDNDYIPPVYIDNFYIFNKNISISDPHSPLKQAVSETKEIVLSYKQNVFSLGFTAINFTFPENAIYAYKMGGYDKDWVYTDISRSIATYTNLDPGKYTFQVKATNNDGIWNETPASINIIITPPFWKTLWFRILSILVIFSSIFFIIRNREHKQKMQKQILEEMVNLRTSELENVNNLLNDKQIEIMKQNVEITHKNEKINTQKEILEVQKTQLETAYKDLSEYEQHLVEIIEDRTKDLVAAKQKAEESDQLKSSFLTNLSHEIRTPLNAIVGFSDLLISFDNDADKQQMFKSIIRNNSETLLNLIDDIIDLSKIEAGQIEITPLSVNIGEMLREINEMYKVEIEQLKTSSNKNIDFRILAINEWDNTIILTDKTRLLQIIQNLLNNAIKFTDEGFVELSCKLIQDGNKLCFSVKDSGIGIKAEHFNLIFDRFRKVENVNEDIFRGAGLGLSICKQLTKLLEGTISVQSELGIGSVFQLTIPFVPDKEVHRRNQQIKSNITIPDLTGKRVLLVEDDEANASLISIYLAKTNVTLINAVNGLEAVNLFVQNYHFDIVLMDIKMPVMDGFEAFKEIQKINTTTPIIAQTAYAYENDKAKIIAMGFKDYLIKPIHKKVLYKLLQDYLK